MNIKKQDPSELRPHRNVECEINNVCSMLKCTKPEARMDTPHRVLHYSRNLANEYSCSTAKCCQRSFKTK